MTFAETGVHRAGLNQRGGGLCLVSISCRYLSICHFSAMHLTCACPTLDPGVSARENGEAFQG
jgi:hypothetical protein